MNKNRFNSALIVLIGFFLVQIAGCTKTIDSGDYGPFTIGDHKTVTLKKIVARGNRPAPIVRERIYIDQPKSEEFQRLNSDDGILVWFDRHPSPLRIVLKDNRLNNTWGIDKSCTQVFCEELKKLEALLPIGLDREGLYRALYKFPTHNLMQVGNFVPGYQRFRTRKKYSIQEYEKFILTTNTWRVYGLKELLWYDHFYSEVRFFFEDEELSKIEHHRFPFEVP